jgi:hypothetical protein
MVDFGERRRSHRQSTITSHELMQGNQSLYIQFNDGTIVRYDARRGVVEYLEDIPRDVPAGEDKPDRQVTRLQEVAERDVSFSVGQPNPLPLSRRRGLGPIVKLEIDNEEIENALQHQFARRVKGMCPVPIFAPVDEEPAKGVFVGYGVSGEGGWLALTGPSRPDLIRFQSDGQEYEIRHVADRAILSSGDDELITWTPAAGDVLETEQPLKIDGYPDFEPIEWAAGFHGGLMPLAGATYAGYETALVDLVPSSGEYGPLL